MSDHRPLGPGVAVGTAVATGAFGAAVIAWLLDVAGAALILVGLVAAVMALLLGATFDAWRQGRGQ